MPDPVILKDAELAMSADGRDAAPPPQEVELKLHVTPRDMKRLRAAMTRLAGAKPKSKTLVTTYFDTHHRDFLMRRAALRVRSTGKDFVQTLKNEGEVAYGIRTRGEWETPVAANAPQPALFVADEARSLLAAVDLETLAPVFTSDFKRHVWNVERNGSTIEIALDSGAMIAGAKEAPISELEMELKGGDPAEIMHLAETLAADFPLSLGVASKAAQGYALASGEPPAHATAPDLHLDPAMPTEEAWIAIVNHCIGHFLDNAACAIDGRNPHGVHQCRVAIRRLRSGFSVFKKTLPQEQAVPLAAEAKALAAALGPARDLDVFIAETLMPLETTFADVAPLKQWHEKADAAREAAYDTVRTTLTAPETTRFFLRLNAWLATRAWREAAHASEASRLDAPLGRLAHKKLDRRLKAARRAGRGFDSLSVEERHEVRIALKKLRYTAEFFASLYDAEITKPFLKRLAALQKRLGRMNDIAVAQTLIDRFAAGDASSAAAEARGLLIGWHAHAMRDDEGELRDAWRKFVKSEPFWRDED
jgi:inorganic triphosphatase YgiF